MHEKECRDGWREDTREEKQETNEVYRLNRAVGPTRMKVAELEGMKGNEKNQSEAVSAHKREIETERENTTRLKRLLA